MIKSFLHPRPICTSIYARKYKFLYFNVMSQVENSSAKQSFNCSPSTYLFFIAVFYRPCCTMYLCVLDRDMLCETLQPPSLKYLIRHCFCVCRVCACVLIDELLMVHDNSIMYLDIISQYKRNVCYLDEHSLSTIKNKRYIKN